MMWTLWLCEVTVCSLGKPEGWCVSPQCPVLSYLSMLSYSWSTAGHLSSLPACLLSESEGCSWSLVSCQWLDLSSLSLLQQTPQTERPHTDWPPSSVLQTGQNFMSPSVMLLSLSCCLLQHIRRALNRIHHSWTRSELSSMILFI